VIDLLRYHKLSDKDKQGQLLEVYNEGILADNPLNLDYVDCEHSMVPLDQILIVVNWCVLGNGSGGQAPFAAMFGASFTLAGTKYFTALNEREIQQGYLSAYLSNTVNPIIILPEERPTVRCRFASNDAGLTATSRIRGFLIPKGPLGRGFGSL